MNVTNYINASRVYKDFPANEGYVEYVLRNINALFSPQVNEVTAVPTAYLKNNPWIRSLHPVKRAAFNTRIVKLSSHVDTIRNFKEERKEEEKYSDCVDFRDLNCCMLADQLTLKMFRGNN